MKLTIRFWILISLLLFTVTKVFTNISVVQSKAALAKKFPSLVVIYPLWDKASITHNPLIFNDLEGNPQFYLFGIFKENKNLGYCAIGARKNLPFLFEASMDTNLFKKIISCKELINKYLYNKIDPSKIKQEFITTTFGSFLVKFTIHKLVYIYDLKTYQPVDSTLLQEQHKIISEFFKTRQENFE